MTTITVRPAPEGGAVLRCEGHAGNRELCIGITWSLRTLAHCLEVAGALVDVSLDAAEPSFTIAYSPTGRRFVAETLWVIDQYAAAMGASLAIDGADDLRHDGDRIRQSA